MIYDTNCLELDQISQIKAIVLRNTALLSDTSHKLRVFSFPYLLSTSYEFGGSHDSFRFDNLLEQLIGFREVLATLTVLL